MRDAGYCLVEMVLTAAVAVTLAGMAMPSLVAARNDVRARGAADYLASQLHLARLEALKRHLNVGMRFEPAGTDYRHATFVDGNGNGLRNAEIGEGVDTPLRPPELLGQRFASVGFGLDEGVPEVDGLVPEDGNPIRAGRSSIISFSPSGSSTSGTVYILGRGPRQLAVRVLGPTGRIRTFEFHYATHTWRAR